jgi:hypothetical protein
MKGHTDNLQLKEVASAVIEKWDKIIKRTGAFGSCRRLRVFTYIALGIAGESN